MKKVICSLFFVLLVAGVVTAHGIDVPKKIAATFKAKYPTAEAVAWSMEEGIYSVEFVLDGYNALSTFETNEEWEKTVIEVDEDYLSNETINYLEETYDDVSINAVSKIEDKSGITFMVRVEVTTTDDEDEETSQMVTLKFDEDGNLINK